MRTTLSTFFAILFIMSMISAAGFIEKDSYLIGFTVMIIGISSGLLTLTFQNK